MSKKRYFYILTIVILILLLPGSLLAAELPLKAESAILVDAESGKILYEKEPHLKAYPASMTKIMTLVLAAEAIENGKVTLDDVVTASERAAGYGGSQIYLGAGEKLTLKELLLGVALASGNDASVAVAEYIAGSHEGFVELMNAKAVEIGMTNTHFVNCNGLHDPEHYTTAYDFAQLGLYALKYPLIRELSTVKHYRIREETKNPFQYDNTNKLLWQYEGADGFKTGWTVDAKYCLTATCERNNLRFVSVVMGIPEKSGHFIDTKVLFDWGYAQYTYKQFHGLEEVLGSVSVGKGAVDTVAAIPEKKVGLTVPKGEEKDLRTEITLNELIDSPVQKGQIVGYASILKGEEVLTRINLVAKDNVEKGSWWRQFTKVLKRSIAGQ